MISEPNVPALLLSNPYLWLISVLSLGAGAFLESYLKAKGEKLATHEDFQTLLGEVKQTTETTKGIEARINERLWGRQRQWDVTREVSFALIQAQNHFAHASEEYLDFKRGLEIQEKDQPEHEAVLKSWQEARRVITDTVQLATFVCWSKDVSQAASGYLMLLENFHRIPTYKIRDEITRNADSLAGSFATLRDAIRRELGLQRKEGDPS